MKAQILNINGKKIKEIETNLFEEPIRKDIIFKVIESEKLKQPYSPTYRAGMNRSASGNVTHRRHSWKSDRGRGLSRIPRKIFWRRGTQFSWQGAVIPSARGGRKSHAPKGSVNLKKINKKEMRKALLSALKYSISVKELKEKYSSLKHEKTEVKFPIIVEEKILELKTKDFLASLKKILQEFYEVAIQKKAIRAGKGKLRGRKYKKNAGVLFVIGKNEKIKIKEIEVVNAHQLLVTDLANNGARISMFSEKAINELEKDFIKTKPISDKNNPFRKRFDPKTKKNSRSEKEQKNIDKVNNNKNKK